MIIRLFFFLLLCSTFVNAEYPKTYARLGTPLFQSTKAFEKLEDIPNLTVEIENYKNKSRKLLILGTQADSSRDKKVKKEYLVSLRKLQKSYEYLLNSLHQAILQSIIDDDYALFLKLTSYAFDGLFQNRNTLNKAIEFYVIHKQKSNCLILDKKMQNAKLLQKTNKLFAAEILHSSYNSKSKKNSKQRVGIRTQRAHNRIDIYFYNKNFYDVTIKVNAKYKNLRPSENIQKEFVLKAHSSLLYTQLKVMNAKAQYSYSWHYTMGSKNAHHNDDYVYRLPYKIGTSHMVSQGYNGTKTHKGHSAYAIDFPMPVGTKVYASRGGIVVKTKANSDVGGYEKKYASSGNYVTVLHNDGTFGIYYHLQYRGVLVKIGQRVSRGEALGYSGNTGYSSGPHLHFAVYKATSAQSRMTLPTSIVSTEGIMKEPQKGHYYTAK